MLGTADLDACHGHTHTITWDGRPVAMYHHHATLDYPYTLGCCRGAPPSGATPRSGGAPPNR